MASHLKTAAPLFSEAAGLIRLHVFKAWREVKLAAGSRLYGFSILLCWVNVSAKVKTAQCVCSACVVRSHQIDLQADVGVRDSLLDLTVSQ